MVHRIFAYGSLKRGCHNHHYIEQADYLGEHSTDARYTLISLGDYPAVINHGNTAIHGEVYAVDDLTFKSIDELEDYPELYDRICIPTPFGQAWMYIVDSAADNEVVESGLWKE